MALPLLQTDSQNERQHRTLIATTVNSLIPLRQPNERTTAEINADITPSDTRYPASAVLGYSVLREGADNTGVAPSDEAFRKAIAVAKLVGVANGTTGRDQGIDIHAPAGLYEFDNPVLLPRSGNARLFCVGIVGDGDATRFRPSANFPAGRALFEWEPTTARVFHQRLKNFKIDMRTGLNHKAIHFALNDPGTIVSGGQQYSQEEIKELDIDVMIHGDNTSHAVLVDIEGKIKYSRIKIEADLAIGTAQTYSTIVLRANSQYINTSGTAGDKSDAIVDNAGVNYSYVNVFAVNSRGGRATAFKGRIHDSFAERLGSATGAFGSASVVELYGSSALTVGWLFCEGRQEDPQIYMEECHYNTFLSCVVGTPDAPGPGTAFRLVRSEDNVFWNHPSASGKPSYSSQGGFLIDLGVGSDRNQFRKFASTGAFASEVRDLGTDNYIEFIREGTGLVTETHRRASYSVGPWTQDNVTASQTDVELTGNRWVAPRDGLLKAVTVKSTEARTASTLTVKVFKSSSVLFGATGAEVSSSFRAQLSSTNTSFDVQLALNDYQFAAGDEIYAAIETPALWTPVTADIRVWIEVQC